MDNPGYYDRGELELEKPKYVTPITTPVTECWVHHGGDSGPNPATTEQAITRWRNYQRYHMHTKGWSDIAYNHGVTPQGDLFRGRGWKRQGGATGSPQDARSMSICAIGNYDVYKPPDALLEALAAHIAWGSYRQTMVPMGELNVYGHREKGTGTACPGRYLMRALPEVIRAAKELYDGTSELTLEQRVTALEVVVFGNG